MERTLWQLCAETSWVLKVRSLVKTSQPAWILPCTSFIAGAPLITVGRSQVLTALNSRSSGSFLAFGFQQQPGKHWLSGPIYFGPLGPPIPSLHRLASLVPHHFVLGYFFDFSGFWNFSDCFIDMSGPS